MLVLVPTRELAAQVGASFVTYGRQLHSSVAVVYGGVGQGPQVRALSRGVDVLVATPGRLLDLMGQRHVQLERVEVLVLDEADHMLDLGFIPDVRKVLAVVPRKRQTLFFSATMPAPIAALAERMLSNPVKVVVTPAASTVDEVRQRVHFVSRGDKPAVLARLLSDPEVLRALVFTRTKRGADKVMRRLMQDGITAEAIHGNKSQGARERTLKGFKSGRTRVLVATDIAARGIDIDDVTHVINFELPNVPESYVHRIGRTARAGASGVAISLCEPEERPYLRDIEKLIRRTVEVAEGSAERASHGRDEPRAQAHQQGRKPHVRTSAGGGRGRSTRGHSAARQHEHREPSPAARRHGPRSPHSPHSIGGGSRAAHSLRGRPAASRHSPSVTADEFGAGIGA